jgi:hypothetical protein
MYGACDVLPMMSPKLWFSMNIQMTWLYAGGAVTVPHGPVAAIAAGDGVAATIVAGPPHRARARAAVNRTVLRIGTSVVE